MIFTLFSSDCQILCSHVVLGVAEQLHTVDLSLHIKSLLNLFAVFTYNINLIAFLSQILLVINYLNFIIFLLIHDNFLLWSHFVSIIFPLEFVTFFTVKFQSIIKCQKLLVNFYYFFFNVFNFSGKLIFRCWNRLRRK